MEKAVLIISTAVDKPTDAVEQELISRNVPVVRFNTDSFPFDSSLTYKVAQGKGIALILNNTSDFRSIWYRRFRSSKKPESMDPAYFAFSEKESRYALIGSLLSLSREVPTINSPEAVWAAEHKPYQLAIAAQCGLKIPDTLISNLPSEAEAFFSVHQPDVITKPVRTGYIDDPESPKAIYTSKVNASHMEHISRLSVSPVTFQPLIHKHSDIRVTIVGGRIFTAEICSQTDRDATVDWRKTSNPDLPHQHHSLPNKLENKLLQFVKLLGLVYGAIDLILDTKGNYFFLEINPGGQWLWLDRILNLGITQSISDWLEYGRDA